MDLNSQNERAKERAKELVTAQESTQQHCPYCMGVIDSSESFCPDCGASLNTAPKVCPQCGVIALGIHCENCGAEVELKICPACGQAGFGDWCPMCGEAVSNLAKTLEKDEKTNTSPPREMKEDEAQSIKKELSSCLTPEILKMQEKMAQRVILLRERKYFQDREKRIEEYYSKNGHKIVSQPKEEFEMIRKAQESLSGFISREKEREELKRWEEEERLRLEELVMQKKEKERRALEWEREKRREQERNSFQTRIVGTYVTTSGCWNGILKIQLSDGQFSGTHWMKQTQSESVDKIEGTFNGSGIHFWTTASRILWIAPNWERVALDFTGKVSTNGENITGYMSSAEYWQEHYIKQ